MLNCSSEDPCAEGSCTKTFHRCTHLGSGIFQQCGASNSGDCQAVSKCYMECRGTHLSGTACKDREVTTGSDCNNAFVKTGDLGMACTVDPDDSTRCIEKHPCALPLWAPVLTRMKKRSGVFHGVFLCRPQCPRYFHSRIPMNFPVVLTPRARKVITVETKRAIVYHYVGVSKN